MMSIDNDAERLNARSLKDKGHQLSGGDDLGAGGALHTGGIGALPTLFVINWGGKGKKIGAKSMWLLRSALYEIEVRPC